MGQPHMTPKGIEAWSAMGWQAPVLQSQLPMNIRIAVCEAERLLADELQTLGFFDLKAIVRRHLLGALTTSDRQAMQYEAASQLATATEDYDRVHAFTLAAARAQMCLGIAGENPVDIQAAVKAYEHLEAHA